MSYTPTLWNENDIITAEKLNNIESGIGSLDNVLDLGEHEILQQTGNIGIISISLTEDQITSLNKDNVFIFFTLNINNSLFKIPLEKTTFFTEDVSTFYLNGVMNMEPFSNYSFNIIGAVSVGSQSSSILLYVIDNSLPIIASFDSEEEIDGAEGSLDFRVDSLEEIAIGVPGGYHGQDAKYFLHKIKSTPTASGVDVTIFGTSLIYQEENKTFLKIITCECGGSTYTMSCKTQEITSTT